MSNRIIPEMKPPDFDDADIFVIERTAGRNPQDGWAKCWQRIRPLIQWAVKNREAYAVAPASSPSSGPIPMILSCPTCRERHIDAGKFATKPHHTHACQGCGFVWRPAVVPTVGVQFLPGFKDSVYASDRGETDPCTSSLTPDNGLREKIAMIVTDYSTGGEDISRTVDLLLALSAPSQAPADHDSSLSLGDVDFGIDDQHLHIEAGNGVRYLDHAEGERLARWFYAWYLAKRPYPAPTVKESLTPAPAPSAPSQAPADPWTQSRKDIQSFDANGEPVVFLYPPDSWGILPGRLLARGMGCQDIADRLLAILNATRPPVPSAPAAPVDPSVLESAAIQARDLDALELIATSPLTKALVVYAKELKAERDTTGTETDSQRAAFARGVRHGLSTGFQTTEYVVLSVIRDGWKRDCEIRAALAHNPKGLTS